HGHDISTFPNYPADIRAPQGTLSGVSGFQLKFGSVEVFTPGDSYDVLVAMNAAALKVNLSNLKKGGIIIANSAGFDQKNLKLANYIDEENPLTDHSLDGYELHTIDISKLTREALKDSGLSMKDIDRSKNMFILGFIYWMFSQKPDNTVKFLKEKFKNKPELAEANITALRTGYYYGDTSETFTTRFQIKPAKLAKGNYRNINGNQAIAIALTAAAKRNNLDLFYGSYPITPASEILQELSKHKHFGVKTFQAEDEIAAACSIIGAAFGGSLSATATSGPGMALKTEAIGLGIMMELPMVIINVQRGGPSTGLPTKTEQSDLLQAVYGRNGEAPLPVLSVSSPRDAFQTVYEGCRIALEHMTPVIILSDGYIANGAEPWSFPASNELPEIHPPFVVGENEGRYLPYHRNEDLVRTWAPAGTKGYEHRIGGLEKELETGNVSYDPDNHAKMVEIRAEKVARIANHIPDQVIQRGTIDDEVLVLGWGSTFGAIETAVKELRDEGVSVAHVHLRYIQPFPKNLGDLLSKFPTILIPEMNNGQLVKLIRDTFLIETKSILKVKGLPFAITEIKEAILNEINHVYS
ncbi:MAG: 2-oxoacid:acceptor oxidoreductase subunit alpha, partial [Cyclobacteriaceae bacterium]|nr:2-oxoacid:acceptor oxidoreductase subunit alpha [Cyclobacteriaceae bacterium]